MQEMIYMFTGCNGDHLEVLATNERDARTKIMQERWSTQPDDVVPSAPYYEGLGLYFVGKEYATHKRQPEPIARMA